MTVLGLHMATEMAEGSRVFARAARQDVPMIEVPQAIYTFARGSSDTVANVLSYEFMDQLEIPMTSLPPSVFSVGKGVSLAGALALVISQSGASDDLVSCAKAAETTIAITNVEGSPVESHARCTIRIGAGVEQAVPATKTVIGALGAGLALLAAIAPKLKGDVQRAADLFSLPRPPLAHQSAIAKQLAASQHVYVLGRRCGYGVAQEIALKLKETCAVHAEAYSASEVLHGPLQLSTRDLTVLILDTGDAASRPSLDVAERRFADEGATVLRIGPEELAMPQLIGPAMSAALLVALYPVVHEAATQLGFDPDTPTTLKKVTRTT